MSRPAGIPTASLPIDSGPSRTGERIERALLVIGKRTEVVLARHAQQIPEEQYAPPSHPLGPELSAVGRAQAELLAEYLMPVHLDALYSSDLTRAQQTALTVGSRRAEPLQPALVPQLREIDVFGEGSTSGESLTEDAIERAALDFMHTRRWDSFPNTETSDALRTRVRTALHDLIARHADERICVVAHGAVITSIVASILDTRDDMFFFPAHASVTRLFYGDGRWAVHTLNEIDHLRVADLVSF